MKYKVRKLIVTDEHNAMVRIRQVLINGNWVRLKKFLGSVFKEQTFRDGKVGLARSDSIYLLNGEQYRLGSTICEPLVLKNGEEFKSVEEVPTKIAVIWKT